MSNRLSNLSNRAVLMILIIVALASSGLSLVVNIVNQVDTSPAWWVSWLQNFSTEMFGAFLTFILIELIVGGREKRRDEERATKQERERLVRQMSSSINEEAIRAVEELRARGWLEDGSLYGAYLSVANLRRANLAFADLQAVVLIASFLQEAYLSGAKLQGGNLGHADLEAATMPSANLQRANLEHANLRKANLMQANLQDANLSHANLQRTNFRGANLQGADLIQSHFDENTVFPDGSRWSLARRELNLARFTDPNHPQFWRSDNPESPAYRGKGAG
jgi:hypothetical protein